MDTFAGTQRFRIKARLGEGGTGVVYLARDQDRGIDVALKTLRQASPYGILRLKNEFRGLSEMAHPNLVNLHGLHEREGIWFLTMEYIEGCEFLDWVRPPTGKGNRRVLNLDRLRKAMKELARGVDALHQSGHLHRDIKPPNLMVERGGRLVVLDFGLSTRLGKGQERDIRGFSGTLEYMSPEQSDEDEPVPASDWYSVGVLLFEALTGRLPFTGNPLRVAMDKRRKDGPSPLSVVPDLPSDLSRLCTALLRSNPRLRPTGAEVLKVLEVVSTATSVRPAQRTLNRGGPLLGREAELGLLVESLAELRRGHPVSCAVHGQSGMGKSALVRHFLDPLRTRGDILMLRGRCYQRESVPYKALDSMVDALARRLSQLPVTEVEALLPANPKSLARVFPVLMNIPSIARAQDAQPEPHDPRERRRRAAQELRQLLSAMGRWWTLIIHIDDVQWGDADSAAFLCDVLRPPDTPPLMFIWTFHTEDWPGSPFLVPFMKFSRAQGKSITVRRVELGPLSTRDSQRLAISLLGDSPKTSHWALAIAKEAQGNPFFIETLARAVRQGDLDRSQDAPSLHAALSARVLRLEPEARHLLNVTCVAQRPLLRQHTLDIAALAARGPRALSVLRAENLVRVRSSGLDETVEPYHERIRQVVLDLLTSEKVHELNRDIAHTLEGAKNARPENLVDHLVDAGELARAQKHAAQAAAQAADKLAFDRAAQLYTRALELKPPSANEETHSADQELAMARADALLNAGQGIKAATAFELLAKHGPKDKRLEYSRKAGALLLFSGHIKAGLLLLKDVLNQVGLPFPETRRAALYRLARNRAFIAVRGLKSRVGAASDLDPGALEAIDVCWSVALGLGLVDHVRAAVFQSQCLLASLRVGEPYRLCRTLAMESAYVAAGGRRKYGRALRLAHQAENLAETLRKPHAIGLAAYGRGVTHFLNGAWHEAQRSLDKAAFIFRERCNGMIWEVATTKTFLFSAMAFRGETNGFLQQVTEELQDARLRGNLYFAVNLRTGYPNLAWLCRDQPESAARQLSDAMAEWGDQHPFHVQHYFDLVARVNISLYTGDWASAHLAVEESWTSLKTSMVQRIQFVHLDLHSLRIRAALGLLSEKPSNAGELFKSIRRDLRVLKRGGMPWTRAQALLFEAILSLYTADDPSTLAAAEYAAWQDAIEALDQSELVLFAAAARIALGLQMGTRGVELAQEGEAMMASRGILRPLALSRIYVPGCALEKM